MPASWGRVVDCGAPVAVFLQSRMSQTFHWCNLCQSFIYSLLSNYIQQVRNLYLIQRCKTVSWFLLTMFHCIINFCVFFNFHTIFIHSFLNSALLNFFLKLFLIHDIDHSNLTVWVVKLNWWFTKFREDNRIFNCICHLVKMYIVHVSA